MKKPDTSFEFIEEWFLKAAENAQKQGRNESALLWRDGLQHLRYMHDELDEIKKCKDCPFVGQRQCMRK